MSAFTPQQVQDLALVFLTLNARAYDIYLVFFGLWCVLIGYLIFRSIFLPRILGVLLIIDGVGWMLYLFPPLAQQLFPLIAVAAICLATLMVPLLPLTDPFGLSPTHHLASPSLAHPLGQDEYGRDVLGQSKVRR